MRIPFKYYIVYRYMDIKGISKNWYKHFLHGLHQRNRHPLKWRLWWFYKIHFRSFQQFSVKFGVKRETIRLICLKSTKFGFHGSFWSDAFFFGISEANSVSKLPPIPLMYHRTLSFVLPNLGNDPRDVIVLSIRIADV